MKKIIVALVAVMGFAAATFAMEAGEIRGQLVSLDSRQNSITVKTEVLGLSGPEMKDVNFSVSSNVKWTVCLSGQCAEKTGLEGFRLVNEYASFEAYGITPKGSSVTLQKSGDAISGIRVNL